MNKVFDASGLHWEFRKDLSILRDGEQRLLDMRVNRKGAARIVGGTDKWGIHVRGFWIPRVVMKHNDRTVAVVEGRANGEALPVELSGGRRYDLHVKYDPEVNVVVKTPAGKEIMRYGHRFARPKPRPIFELKQADLPYDDMITLVVLGCHVFISMQNEAEGIIEQPKGGRRSGAARATVVE